MLHFQCRYAGSIPAERIRMAYPMQQFGSSVSKEPGGGEKVFKPNHVSLLLTWFITNRVSSVGRA